MLVGGRVVACVARASLATGTGVVPAAILVSAREQVGVHVLYVSISM